VTERAYPLPLPDAASDDYRFTFGLADDISQVLERHGFPPVRNGQDRDDLMRALLGFIYAPAAPAAPSLPWWAEVRHVPRVNGAGVQVCTGCTEVWGLPVRWPCRDAAAHSGLAFTHAMQLDGSETPRCGAPVGARIALFAENVTCPTCQYLLNLQLAEANAGMTTSLNVARETSEFDPDDDAHEGRFTAAQLDGTACSECGRELSDGGRIVPAGITGTGYGPADITPLYAHLDCLTDTTTTEPPGDAP